MIIDFENHIGLRVVVSQLVLSWMPSWSIVARSSASIADSVAASATRLRVSVDGISRPDASRDPHKPTPGPPEIPAIVLDRPTTVLAPNRIVTIIEDPANPKHEVWVSPICMELVKLQHILPLALRRGVVVCPSSAVMLRVVQIFVVGGAARAGSIHPSLDICDP